jgi:hypothetical protein
MVVDNAPFGILLFKDSRTPSTVKGKRLPLGLAFPIHKIRDPSSVSTATDIDNDFSCCNLASWLEGSKETLLSVDEGIVSDPALG